MRSRRSTAVALVFLATFTDLLAYSIAVPILPDLSARFGASPTVIGLLFSSFGLTMLMVSIPMGTVSDRVGRTVPMVAGLIVLAAASVLFALADSLAWLFAARLAQGIADAITWVVGLSLIADLYEPSERGRIMGIVMTGPGLAFMIGPSIGGWLYEMGGMRLPFFVVAGMCSIELLGFLWLVLPSRHMSGPPATLAAALRARTVVMCVAVVVTAAATIAMLEPIVVLQLERFHINPARIGLLFGIASVVTATLNPIYGRLTDRFGAWRLMLLGLVLAAAMLPILGRASGLWSATVFYAMEAAAISLVITPSLSFMAEASADVPGESFGLSYGLYNVGWGIGLLAGPAVGGFLFERLGFALMLLLWTPALLAATLIVARFGARRSRRSRTSS